MSKEVLSVEDTVQSREVSVEVVLKDGTEEYRSEGFIKGRYIDSLKQDGGYRDLFNRLFRHLEHDIVEKMRV